MANDITHIAAVRNAVCDAIVDQIDSGTTLTWGEMRLLDGATPLVEISCTDPAFGGAAAGEATAAAFTDGTATDVGTADIFNMVSRDENTVFSGTVGIGVTFDLNLDNNVIASGQTVAISSMTYKALTV